MTRARSWLLALFLLVMAMTLVVGGPVGEVRVGEHAPAGAEYATVTFVDESGSELGQVSGPVLDNRSERYTGLSETESLDPNEGMIFVYDDEATRSFVMQNMSFPLDIIFVGADRRITVIHHAAVDDEGRFTGKARWVIEVNRGYTDEHGVSVGDEVQGLPR
ncbi:MAG: DUF192 domain-containing protein [Halodesulfurarchaeum sp.]|nr:DUF192 domain-containing protein [Halodesulfurarchaeum sp.]